MELSNFYAAYFNRDQEKLNSIAGIHIELKVAIRKHWSGDLHGALKILEEFQSILPPSSGFNEFVAAEILLINAKLGNTQAFNKITPFKILSVESRYIAEYAAFSMAFWIDHKVAWRALWKLLILSINLPIKGSTSMVVFLMCHLSAISGKRPGVFRKATAIYEETIKDIQSNNEKPNFFQNIIIAAYPYTLFVASQISEKLSLILANGEKLLPNDPYYRALFSVSGLYCYAYSGDVTRTELYVSRLNDAQEKGNLLRYRPVARIMKFLPFALRGYGFLIEDEFKSMLLTESYINGHPLITSQFCRASAIIYLSLGEFENAEKSINQTISERHKTKSFFAWEPFDLHILKLAKNRRAFNPENDPILNHKLQFENNSQFMRFLIEMLSLVSSSVLVTEDEFYLEIRNKISCHLDHKDIGIENKLNDELMVNPVIKVGQKFFVLRNVPREREVIVRSLLNSMGPISIILMNGFNSQKKAQDFEKAKSFANMASQVSHDIRSPLSALSMVLPSIENIPEDKRLLIRNATQRINDIANQLLTKSKQHAMPDQTDQAAQVSVELLPSILDVIISEKRIQFRDKLGVEIDLDVSKAYGSFVSIGTAEFKRVLSNLVNNSVEAFKNERGRITVSLTAQENNIELIITDNGNGIPPHILTKLGTIGVTHGKADSDSGSGLGIYHAKKTIEALGGTFDIKSIVGTGTNIIIKFKRAPTPKWFIENLNLTESQTVVFLDDDVSIHQVWRDRFNTQLAQDLSIKTVHFSSGQDLRQWFSENSSLVANTTFLMDYELLGQADTGLDIIESLGINANSILVTSRFEEEPIRQRCNNLGVKLIPKGMATIVPIVAKPVIKYYDACLIDDDNLVRMTWEFVAKEKGASLFAVNSEAEFFKKIETIDKESPIFVDMNLGEGISGIDVVKRLSNNGFEKLYLATGYAAELITDIPDCVICVRGKEPLFET